MGEAASPRGPIRVGWVLKAIAAGAILLGAHPAGSTVASHPPDPSPEETRQELMAFCEAHGTGGDPFFGRGRARELEEMLGRLGDDPGKSARIRGQLGTERRRLGDLEGAIEAFEAALGEVGEGAGDGPLRLQLLRDLALAHLLLAEDENCLLQHSADSCLLPLRDGALHRRPEHTRRAAELYRLYLEAEPGDLHVRWLYNLSRRLAGDSLMAIETAWRLPVEVLMPSTDPEAGRFRNRAFELGTAVDDLAGGAAVDDFDGDGLLDIVTSSWDPCEPMKAFRNDGRGGFEDVTQAWGLHGQLAGLNLVHADFDGDGHLDLLVLRGAWRARDGEIRNSLLRNDLHGETGRFVDVTRKAGIVGAFPTQTAAWADFDGDGDLDLYVGNESGPDGRYPSQLFRNRGDGKFEEMAAAAGVANLRFAKGVAWGDVDDDGDPDLFVSNLGGPNRLYRNEGDGTFTDVAAAAGVAERPRDGFATWFFDVDHDGRLDLFVADYGAPYPSVTASYFGVPSPAGHPVLYRNEGNGTFRDVSREMGLVRPLLPMGANHGDFDNDGWLDIYLGTGVPDLESLMPNVAYRNDRGRRFVDVSERTGLGHLQKGHGIAFADLDNDGDQDIVEQMGGAFPVDSYFNVLYENPTDGARSWVTLRLEGRRANRFGVGARLEVRVRERTGGSRVFHHVVGAGGSFGSSSLQAEVGLGDAVAIDEVVVRWPGSGTVDRFSDVPLDRFLRIIEGNPELIPLELPRLHLGGGAGSSGLNDRSGR